MSVNKSTKTIGTCLEKKKTTFKIQGNSNLGVIDTAH